MIFSTVLQYVKSNNIHSNDIEYQISESIIIQEYFNIIN